MMNKNLKATWQEALVKTNELLLEYSRERDTATDPEIRRRYETLIEYVTIVGDNIEEAMRLEEVT